MIRRSSDHDRDARIRERLAELRRDEAARAWGGLVQEARDDVDAALAAERTERKNAA